FETKYDTFGDARILRNELYTGSNQTTSDQLQSFDKLGNITSITHRGGLLTDYYAYDELGHRLSDTQSWTSPTTGSAVAKTDYDAAGRVVREQAFGGDVTSYKYEWLTSLNSGVLGDYDGWKKTVTNANTLTTSESTDYFGHVIARTDMSATGTSFTYDRGGRLANTATGSDTTSYSWLSAGWIGTVTAYTQVNATTTIQTSAYDAAGNKLTEAQTRNGSSIETAAVTWDALNRMTSWSEANGGTAGFAVTTAYEYDRTGNIRRSHGTYGFYGDQWFLYDTMNRVTTDRGILSGGAIVRGTANDGTPYGNGANTGTNYTYDKSGNRMTATHTVHTVVDSLWIGDDDGDFGHIKNFYKDLNVTESYSYNGDGTLATVSNATDTWTTTTGGVTAGVVAGVAQLRANFWYDARGQVIHQTDWNGNGVNAAYDRVVTYDAAGHVLTEVVTQKQGSDTIYSTTTNQYGTTGTTGYKLGAVTYSETASHKNSDGTVTSSTTNTYAMLAGPVLSLTQYKPDKTQSTTYTSTYSLTALGVVTAVAIVDGRSRNVSFTNDINGQVIRREEADGNTLAPDPYDIYLRFAGREMGHVTNNGTFETDYASSIANRQQVPGTGAFQNGSSTQVSYNDFSQSVSPINSYQQGNGGGTYVVQAGDTLASIAAATWGDASLWYKIADANGLSAASALVAGQRLTIPDGVSRTGNSVSSYNPYDPTEALGNNSPTTPKPAKKPKCGLMILMVVVAVVVTAIATAGAAAAISGKAFGVVLGSMLGSGAAAGVTTAAWIAGGAIGGAIGSIASQGFGIAVGIQSSINWKSVAIAGISGAVGGAMAPTGGSSLQGGVDAANSAVVGSAVQNAVNFANSATVVSGAARALSTFGTALLRGVASNAITQGIAKITGLQKNFDFASVAVAGLSSGVGATISGQFHGVSTSLQRAEAGLISGMASEIAGAAARSVLTGSDFGDTIVAALPDVIGTTIGNLLMNSVTTTDAERIARQRQKIEKFYRGRDDLPAGWTDTVSMLATSVDQDNGLVIGSTWRTISKDPEMLSATEELSQSIFLNDGSQEGIGTYLNNLEPFLTRVAGVDRSTARAVVTRLRSIPVFERPDLPETPNSMKFNDTASTSLVEREFPGVTVTGDTHGDIWALGSRYLDPTAIWAGRVVRDTLQFIDDRPILKYSLKAASWIANPVGNAVGVLVDAVAGKEIQELVQGAMSPIIARFTDRGYSADDAVSGTMGVLLALSAGYMVAKGFDKGVDLLRTALPNAKRIAGELVALARQAGKTVVATAKTAAQDAKAAVRALRAKILPSAAKGAGAAEDAFSHGYTYADRVRVRGVQDPVSHNFPYSFDDAILKTNPIPKANGYNIYQMPGIMGKKSGVFEIGVTKNGVIDHRFFRPDK
ncbi:LysM peptidoglycan-binding domain-containing protein, partial [Sphingomonas sp.]|uniref:LysM peptidoglycan-binding domain-containing protein n=1 Tax=Sphingomonas sp. TaxID=28214 RepID=UPI001B134716